MGIYGYPDVGRFGLGHSLLAWGRCAVWCEEVGATMLSPRWLRPRFGPYLRGERDKREYFKLFQRADMIGEPTRSLIMSTGRKVISNDGYFQEDIFSTRFIQSLELAKRPTIVVFKNSLANNDGKHFHSLVGHSKLLKKKIEAMVKPKYRPNNSMKENIAIHVRLGDFSAPVNGELNINSKNVRLPIDWYCDALKQLRKDMRKDLAAVVYSDGTDEELQKLLSLNGVTRSIKQESVTDMLSMTTACTLIASGSGFSLWSAYLGQVPSVFHPGRQPSKFLEDSAGAIEWFPSESYPEKFLNLIQNRESVGKNTLHNCG